METTKDSTNVKFELDNSLLMKGALVFRAINHKLRQEFIKYLERRGEKTVTEIYVKFKLEQSVASQHLRILRQAGFVNTRRDGKYIYYSVNHQRLQEVHDISNQLVRSKG